MIGTMSPATYADHYKKLFSEMVEGFALHEAVRDEEGTLLDYRFLEVNHTYERISGKISSNMVGRTVREVFPKQAPLWWKYSRRSPLPAPR